MMRGGLHLSVPQKNKNESDLSDLISSAKSRMLAPWKKTDIFNKDSKITERNIKQETEFFTETISKIEQSQNYSKEYEIGTMRSQPTLPFTYDEKDKIEFTIPDVHGHTLKIIDILVNQNILDLTKDDYKKINALYNKETDKLTTADLEEFKKILDKSKVQSGVLLRFIGDVLGDRGRNDVFTFLLLDRLKEANVPIRILLSNHDLVFLKGISEKIETGSYTHVLYSNQQRSVSNFIKLYENKVIQKEQIDKWVKNYFSDIQLFDYSITESSDSKKIFNFFTHAPVGYKIVKMVCEDKDIGLNIKYMDAMNLEGFAKQIDQINTAFKERIKMPDGLAWLNKVNDNERNPLYLLAWNRNKEFIKAHPHFTLCNIHGHSGDGHTERDFLFTLSWRIMKSPHNIIGYNLDYFNGFGLTHSSGGVGEGPLSLYVSASKEAYDRYLAASKRQLENKTNTKIKDDFNEFLINTNEENIRTLKVLDSDLNGLITKLSLDLKDESPKKELMDRCLNVLKQIKLDDLADIKGSECKDSNEPIRKYEYILKQMQKYNVLFGCIVLLSLQHTQAWRGGLFRSNITKMGSKLHEYLIKEVKTMSPIFRICLPDYYGRNIEDIQYRGLRQRVITEDYQKNPEKFFEVGLMEEHFEEINKKLDALLPFLPLERRLLRGWSGDSSNS